MLAGLALLLALGGCGNMTRMVSDPAPQAAPSGSLQAQVDALVQPVLAAKETPGLVVGLLEPDGQQHFFAYGLGEVGGAELNADTRFPVGSLTKGFVAALVTQLVDEGRLRWDETLEQLMPGQPLSAAARRITLEQLASHSAGLPRQPTDLRMLLDLGRFTWDGSNFYRRFDADFLRHYMAEFEPPGKVVPAYSNIGFALIGLAIEARCGQPLETLVRERVLRPLGLTHTGFQGETLPGRPAQGHAGDQPKFMRRGRPVEDWTHSDAMKGSAALSTSARDLLRFAQAHLQPPPGQQRLGELLADNLRVRIPQLQDAPGIAWVTDQMGELAITNQVGMAVGHTSYVGIDRAHGRAVVVLQTSFNWNFKIGHLLLQRLARANTAPSLAAMSAPDSR
ncbi:CubicO group peptidase (beta-lactamase class C family) [Inhella inkyongensis]|uniref:CubicO group peptidase (Beta-lactamase class C family) n=1 Tax=Inhella inkyongensis TaxID=392593 RepID=A0A840S5U7_9BURK|nr:serine hydrolase domain-containing protein [Inhella inkyongensis]MBB5205775.1 CubicO group peptidase (beta-lactamase class C family) [Inhella inkyongensis]